MGETKFRVNYVEPFLNSLLNCKHFSIQQLAINGHPDKLVCINGYFVAIEIKDVGKELEPLQEYHLNEVILSGGVAIRVRQDNWEKVKELLLEIDNPRSTEWKKLCLSIVK